VSPATTAGTGQFIDWAKAHPDIDFVKGDLSRYRFPIPIGRLAQPEDMADAIAFLLSERSRHIAMHDLVVDGGTTLGV
jgi:2,3-dihydro-2,3-dihydroxybenzoate dehydrogenase